MRKGEKFKTYFTGFGIGLILVGFIFYARWKHSQANPRPQPQSQSQPQEQPEQKPEQQPRQQMP